MFYLLLFYDIIELIFAIAWVKNIKIVDYKNIHN